MSSVRLHSYFRSSAAWRLRIALHLKGIPFEYVAVNLLKDEQKAEAYRAMNPLGAVPTLEIDGARLSESVPILEYLEETRPEPPLLPRAPLERAHARRILEAFNAGTQPLQNLRVLRRLESEFGATPEAQKAWAAGFNVQILTGVEALVSSSAGKCCLGDQVTFADVGLVPQLASARRFAVDLTAFPTLIRVEEHLKSLPAFQRADPAVQPDAPK